MIDILATDDPDATELVVVPGARVPYAVVGEVFSDDETTADNDGLASLMFDILTDFGVEQSPADELDADVLAVFTFITDTGNPTDDDIIDLGGNLLDLTNPTTGLAAGGPQVIARGELVTPETEGTFQVVIAEDGEATVLVAQDSTFTTEFATFEAGEGLTIITQADTSGGSTDGNGGSSSGGTSGSSDNLAGMLPVALVGGAATIALAAMGAISFGPIGFALGLFLGAVGTLTALYG